MSVDFQQVAIAGMGAVAGYLLKWMFESGFVRRLDMLEADLKILTSRQGDHEARLRTGNQAFEHLREVLAKLERRIEKED